MAQYKKPTNRAGSGSPTGGSRSPGHRGYRPDPEAGRPKKRWNAEDRAARSGDRGRGADGGRGRSADGPTGGDRRPDWSPRDSRPSYQDRQRRGSDPRGAQGDRRGSDRPAYGDRHGAKRPTSGEGRGAYGDRASGSYGDRQREDRTGRPPYGADRGARSGSGDRAARTERPSYGDRRGSGYGDRADSGRASYGDRSGSGDRQGSDRRSYGDRSGADRADRPAYGDRASGSGRPAYGDRTSGTDRASRDDRAPGTRPSYGDRRPDDRRDGARDRDDRGTHEDRAPRDDRAARGGERPYRGAPSGGQRQGDARPDRGDRPRWNDDRRTPARDDRRGTDGGDASARPWQRDRAGADRPYRDSSDRAYRGGPERRPRWDDRADGHSYGDRRDRPARDDRVARDDRSTGRDDRRDRPREDRAPRTDRESDFYPRRDAAPAARHDDVVLERLEAQVTTAAETDGRTFRDLGLGDNISRQLLALGAEHPFPIQAATIPDVLAGKDVLGRGRTGSGKTIAFGAPVVERLMENNGGKGRKPGRSPRALILAPTRELAMQIDRTVQPIARSVGLFTTTIVGGVPQYKQVASLQRGVDIVIATPGRVEDLVAQGRLDLSEVRVSVLDEADHMCDLGFLEPVQRILRETADGGQKLLFSATLDSGVAQLVEEFLVEPAVHEVAGEDQASSDIDHRVLLIEQREKREIIQELARGEGKTLIFARTRSFAEELADQLDDAGVPATSLHGDLNQSRRTRNLSLLTSGRVNVLVATDVAARGIHVDDISLVIQADAPDEYKTYLHRSGRTGRAGRKGTVVTLVPRARRRRMDELLGRADIEASYEPARPGDALLEELAAL